MNLTRFVRWKLPVVIWAAIILSLTSYPSLKAPSLGFEAQDKLEHCIAYFVLGFLFVRAINEGKSFLSQKAIQKAILFGFTFALFDEIHQLFIPGRSCELWDGVADVVGILLSQFVFLIIYRYRSRSRNLTLSKAKVKLQHEEVL